MNRWPLFGGTWYPPNSFFPWFINPGLTFMDNPIQKWMMTGGTPMTSETPIFPVFFEWISLQALTCPGTSRSRWRVLWKPWDRFGTGLTHRATGGATSAHTVTYFNYNHDINTIDNNDKSHINRWTKANAIRIYHQRVNKSIGHITSDSDFRLLGFVLFFWKSFGLQDGCCFKTSKNVVGTQIWDAG